MGSADIESPRADEHVENIGARALGDSVKPVNQPLPLLSSSWYDSRFAATAAKGGRHIYSSTPAFRDMRVCTCFP